MKKVETLYGPGGIKLVLDLNDSATPALVFNKNKTASATYDCAVGECEYSSIDRWAEDADIKITPAQLEWLDKQADKVAFAYDEARKDDPEYN